MGKQTKSTRSRWTGWELLLLGISAAMIMVPTLLTGYTLIEPTTTLAADGMPQARASSTPSPEGFVATATNTSTPIRTATSTPSPTATATDTAVPSATPTATNTGAPTATHTASATATATNTGEPTATHTASATATQTATSSPLRVTVLALNTSGFRISTVQPGETFNYYIEVAHDVAAATPVTLTNTLPDAVASPRLLNAANGTCAIDGRTLRCSVTPSADQIATVALEVVMSDSAGGTVVTNTVEVQSATGLRDEGSIDVMVAGGAATPTAIPPTATPTTPVPATTPTQPSPTTDPSPAATDLPLPSPTAETPPVPTATVIVPTSTPTRIVSPPVRAPGAPATPTPTNPAVLPVTVSPLPSSDVPAPTATAVPTALPVEVPTSTATVVVPPSIPAPTATAVVPAPSAPQPTAVPAPEDCGCPPGGGGVPGDDAPATGRPILWRGMQGAAVAEAQTLLNIWIAQSGSTGVRPLVVDGIFGIATDMAVRTFQTVQGLTADGIVGPQTWARLLAFDGTMPAPVAPVPVAPAPQAPPAAPSVPDIVPTDVPLQPTAVSLDPTPTFAPTMVPLATAFPTTAPSGSVALRFNAGSGSSEVARGDLVIFTIAVRHAGRGSGGSAPLSAVQLAQPAMGAELQGPTLRDVMIVDEISPALEVFAINSVGVTVRQNGHRIEAARDQMAPGDAAVIVIGARVRDGITLPTITNQASLRYSTLSAPLYSNVVKVRVADVSADASSGIVSTPTAENTAMPTATAAGTTLVPTPNTANPAPTPRSSVLQQDDPERIAVSRAESAPALPLRGVSLSGSMLLGLVLAIHRRRVR